MARNIRNVEEARRFLFWREQLSDPFAFHEMRQAVDRIHRAIREKETIVIVGDYDVDGVTASAILASELDAREAIWHCVIPERVNDGYGLSVDLVHRANDLGAELLITVDNGIRADDAVAAAIELGIDVVVTDHHEPGDSTLPTCTAVVHYTRHEHPEDAIVLSGAGVAWKLTQAMEFAHPRTPATGSNQLHEDWLLGLTALGAVSDMMPMRGENRRIVREGLAALRRCQQPGWLLLCERAKVGERELSVTDVSWKIAPRLNAAGRMAHAETAFQLLMAKQRREAVVLADEIERLNVNRRKATEEAATEAIAQAAIHGADGRPKGIVVSGPWPLGVVGIVAAKLVEKFGCPAIVFSDLDSQPILRGSGRAPGGISLHGIVERCSQWLHHFGGHDAAIGCGIERSHLDAFRAAFQTAIETAAAMQLAEQPKAGDSAATEPLADDYLPLELATLETLDWVARFGPYGPDNEPLRFFLGPISISQVTPMGNGSHLRLRVAEGAVERDLVWFHVPESIAVRIERGRDYAFVVEMSENLWQGKRQLQLRVIDGWKLSGSLSRNDFADVYRSLHQSGRLQVPQAHSTADGDDPTKLGLILDTFVELGFAACAEGAYHVVKSRKRDLRDAHRYQLHLRTSMVSLRDDTAKDESNID